MIELLDDDLLHFAVAHAHEVDALIGSIELMAREIVDGRRMMVDGR